MILSVSRLDNVDDILKGEFGATGGIKIGKKTEVFGEDPAQYQFVHHNPTLPDLGSNPSRRGARR
jgi:hypothetical protein